MPSETTRTWVSTLHVPAGSGRQSYARRERIGMKQLLAAVVAALTAARARGERAVVVLGHATYYPRFGFRQATEFGVHHPEYDGPNLMALGLHGHDVPAGDLIYPAS